MYAAVRSRVWQLWERDPEPRPIRIQERDLTILRFVLEHRFLRPAHIHALIPDGSPDRLSRRMKALWDHKYLERPRAIRPTKVLTEQLVYGLGKKGAQLLERCDATLGGIGDRDWADTPRKQVGFPYVDHQLGIATFMVCLRLGAGANGAQLQWPGHLRRRDAKFTVPGSTDVLLPDAYFALRVPGRGIGHHYLEVDRGNVTLRRMRERYQGYLRFWQDGRDQRDFRHFVLLTVAHDPGRANALRDAARGIGGTVEGASWKGFLFTDASAFSLDEPAPVVGPIWRYAHEGQGVALL